MSFKKIFVLFCISLPLCIAARICQIACATEYSTGFSVIGREWVGFLTLGLICVACAIVAFLSFKTYKNPEKPPMTKTLLSVFACIVAVALLRELIFEDMSPTMPAWQVLALKVTTVLCAGYFAVLAASGIAGFKLPMLSHALPCVYAIVKTVSTFVNISSLALIYDNVLLIFAYCLLMLFFINYGKLYNGLDTEKGFRKLAATGLAAANVCVAQSIAALSINIFGSTPYPHADNGVMWSLLGMSLFIIGFLWEYFYKVETEEEHI